MDHFLLNTSRHRYQRGEERSNRVILEQSLWQTSKKERPEMGVQHITQSRVLDLIKRIYVYYSEKYASVDLEGIQHTPIKREDTYRSFHNTQLLKLI